MPAVIEALSTLTDRYQTTIPEPVRLALSLSKRDKICYEVKANGEVVLSRASDTENEDPVIGKLLELLEADMQQQPGRIEALQPELISQINSLVGQVEVNLNATLLAGDE